MVRARLQRLRLARCLRRRAEVLAYAILGIPTGSVAARLGARRTLLACDLAGAAAVGLIPILFWRDVLSFPALLGLAFAAGAVSTPYLAARRS